MKRYILIDIPCAMLVLMSVLLFMYSFEGWYRFSSIEKSIEQVKPNAYPEYLSNHLDDLGKKDKFIALAAKIHKNDHHEIELRSNYELEIMSGLKSRYHLLVYVSGFFMALSIFLSNGLARHFRKSSNKKIKSAVIADGGSR